MFFRSIFLTIDDEYNEESTYSKNVNNIEDNQEPYNINILNAYLKAIMKKHLNSLEYQVLRLTYGLDCNKHSGLEIASALGIVGISNFARVSEIKHKAVQKLIDNTEYNQFVDIL